MDNPFNNPCFIPQAIFYYLNASSANVSLEQGPYAVINSNN